MYLKALELVGFKSFASKTKLNFDRGMTAIVGPNGCGKSNISDAVRWVLGEQSAKALRGSKMEDVIFNGTDAQKPLSMAEVSLTLADCEQALGTEYDEVTVTRRVLRSGEGQYFINKAPCRLKDIQRLFMDTGIGTNSYSLMEQGRIDLILSSRPEDRRAVFEEASGITKFKADKKEAIRKLDQTEANLLRLADIIREVKRRIISLQRQAGKARRYKELQMQLRSVDLYQSRERLDQLAADIQALEAKCAHLLEQEEAARTDIHDTEQQAHELRAVVQQKENDIAQAMDAASRAVAERDRTKQSIQINQDRIEELEALSVRDHRDAEEAQSRLATHEATLTQLQSQHEEAVARRDHAETDLASATEHLNDLDASVAEIRQHLNQLRGESLDLESRQARLQNELSNLDAEERNQVMRRERLTAEQQATQRAVEKFEHRREEAEAHMASLRSRVDESEQAVNRLREEKTTLQPAITEQRQTIGNLQKQIAGREAQTELYAQSEADAEGLPIGARRVLGREGEPLGNSDHVMGTLADHVQAKPGYEKALEVALRAWLDAVLIRDPEAAIQTLHQLRDQAAGSARLLSIGDTHSAAPTPTEGPGVALIDHVTCSPEAESLARRLLHNVRVVDALDAATAPSNTGLLFVTRDGVAWYSDGRGEHWQPGAQEANPLTRRHLLSEWENELTTLRDELARAEQSLRELVERDAQLEQAMADAQTALAEHRRELAKCEGEHEVKAEEAAQARSRMETVTFELQAIVDQQASGTERRTSITDEIEAVRERQSRVREELAKDNAALHQKEETRGAHLAEVTEKRVALGEKRQQVNQLAAQRDDLAQRMEELQSLIQEREQGVHSYHRRIEELTSHIQAAQERVQPLEADVERHNEALAVARRAREEHTVSLRHLESTLHEKRAALETVRNDRGKLDVQLAEQRMRHQNIIERLSQDYHVTPEELAETPEPEWENGEKPDRETLDTLIAELRTKLESMGPVNLVAIEEHEELEERFQFLTTQQDDLIKAKNQLLEMIRRINNTTTEMFTRTFDKVNINFQETFKQLFGGGSAKLVLVDDQDVLDSGIEIIARPPGKKLQSVSLMSGGERTMTAVALLFALYMVKPSPFCVLDELDAALDDANINRFVTMVEGFVKGSQFVVITHNRRTIEAADALYGVTMEKFGISKIMSVRFNKQAEQTEPAPPETVATS